MGKMRMRWNPRARKGGPAKLAAAREELFKLRMQAATGQLEKPVQLRAARREIARILGIMNESKQEERK